MFHLQSLELLHWDYCQRVTLPLDGAIITIAGPNGSGKTTLLDGLRTLLALKCSGKRDYKRAANSQKAGAGCCRGLQPEAARALPPRRAMSASLNLLQPVSCRSRPAVWDQGGCSLAALPGGLAPSGTNSCVPTCPAVHPRGWQAQ